MHDELVFEVSESALAGVARMVKARMEKAVTLDVPTPIKLNVGTSWGELTEYTIPA